MFIISKLFEDTCESRSVVTFFLIEKMPNKRAWIFFDAWISFTFMFEYCVGGMLFHMNLIILVIYCQSVRGI